MVTVVVFQELPWEENLRRLDSPKELHLTPGIFHYRRDITGYFARTLAIDQNMNLDARPTAFGKSLRKIVGYGTGFVEILGKGDGGSRALYITQHDGKSLIAV